MATIGSAGTLLSQCDEVLNFHTSVLLKSAGTGVKGRTALSSEQWTVFFMLVWTAWGNQLS
uniref:Uncharacterized protein n=1 Tax=Salix viminalis TaxID=40686 RepID=A0A6N2M755_SALVM